MIKAESNAMQFFNALGLKNFAWSLRRLYCPVSRKSLVLDVGSGGNPYPRANILLDAYEDTIERFNVPLISDRPIIYGLIERLPFRDKAFDFVIASHVLEHTADPASFLSEIMRVGKAGYIETPDAFLEKINPYHFHRLEVTDVQGKILIYKKSNWRPHSDLVDSYERKLKGPTFLKFLKKNPKPFYMRFYWEDKFDFEIKNPETDASWKLMNYIKPDNNTHFFSRFRTRLVTIIRFLFSQNLRNRSIDIMPLLQCPNCFSSNLKSNKSNIKCLKCNSVYKYSKGIPVMYPSRKKL